MAAAALRFYIDLIEAAQAAPWRANPVGPFFKSSVDSMEKKYPDLLTRLDRFIDVKTPNPLAIKYGKTDGPFSDYLRGFWHCHLAPDAILIYRLRNRIIEMAIIVQHDDLSRKRIKTLDKQLALV